MRPRLKQLEPDVGYFESRWFQTFEAALPEASEPDPSLPFDEANPIRSFFGSPTGKASLCQRFLLQDLPGEPSGLVMTV